MKVVIYSFYFICDYGKIFSFVDLRLIHELDRWVNVWGWVKARLLPSKVKICASRVIKFVFDSYSALFCVKKPSLKRKISLTHTVGILQHLNAEKLVSWIYLWSQNSIPETKEKIHDMRFANRKLRMHWIGTSHGWVVLILNSHLGMRKKYNWPQS